MGDWVLAKWAGWTDKIMYLTKVEGKEIIETYNKINMSDTKHITATQIFPISSLPPDPPLYDVFIYYKDKSGWVKGL